MTTNTVDPALLRAHVNAMLEVHDDLDAQKIANMNECRRIRERLKTRAEIAEAEGLEKKPFKLAVKQALLERKKARLDAEFAEEIDDLEGDAAETWEQYAEAMGDFAETPLGAASAPKETAAEKRAASQAASRAQLDELQDRKH